MRIDRWLVLLVAVLLPVLATAQYNPPAAVVKVRTTGFGGNLSVAATNVQIALDEIDNLALAPTFVGSNSTTVTWTQISPGVWSATAAAAFAVSNSATVVWTETSPGVWSAAASGNVVDTLAATLGAGNNGNNLSLTNIASLWLNTALHLGGTNALSLFYPYTGNPSGYLDSAAAGLLYDPLGSAAAVSNAVAVAFTLQLAGATNDMATMTWVGLNYAPIGVTNVNLGPYALTNQSVWLFGNTSMIVTSAVGAGGIAVTGQGTQSLTIDGSGISSGGLTNGSVEATLGGLLLTNNTISAGASITITAFDNGIRIGLPGGVPELGSYAVALGDSTEATAHAAIAVGWWTEAYGEASFAWGLNSMASGAFSTAGGYNSDATNDYTFVWNDNATPYYSHGTNTWQVHAGMGHYLDGGPVYVGNSLYLGGTNALSLFYPYTGNPSGFLTAETDPIAIAKTITINGDTQNVGDNPSFTIASGGGSSTNEIGWTITTDGNWNSETNLIKWPSNYGSYTPIVANARATGGGLLTFSIGVIPTNSTTISYWLCTNQVADADGNAVTLLTNNVPAGTDLLFITEGGAASGTVNEFGFGIEGE